MLKEEARRGCSDALLHSLTRLFVPHFCAHILLLPRSPAPPVFLLQGIDNCIARHTRLAEGTRRAVKAWGLELLCSDPRWHSNSLTVIKFPQNLPAGDSTKLVRTAFAKYNLSIGLGLSEVAGKVFRIGAQPPPATALWQGTLCCEEEESLSVSQS